MQSKYFFGFIISFIVGITVESVLSFGYTLSVLCAVLSLIVYFVAWSGSHARSSYLVSLVLFGCAIGVFRVDVTQNNTREYALNNVLERTTQIEGVIVSEPDVREMYTNIVLETHDVLNEKILVLVRAPSYPEFQYGEKVLVTGKISKPKNFSPKEGVRYFDYRAYLAKDDIYYQMYFPKISIIELHNGNLIQEKLFTLKKWLIKNISSNIPEPESSLASGITLGAKQSLGEELLQKFRETGVAHIVVLSGYNIAVVAAIISRLAMFLPFSLRLIISAIGIILFSIMVGGGATVVRATVMALIVILGRVFGRESEALRALVLAGGLMVLVNPMILLHDVSFQLSFSATLAIVVLVPAVEKYFLFISNRVLREIVVTTFATQIFVLPLILYHMGSVSIVGLVSNIFILPVVPIAMLVVALVAVFSWVPLLGSLFAFSAYVLLAYIFIAVDFFARLPFASLHDISFPLFGMIIFYAILGYIIFRSRPR